MGKSVTIRLDEALVRAVRHMAVEHDQSLSEYIADVLRRDLRRQGRLEQSRDRARARMRKGFHLGGKPLSREQAHER